MIERRNAVIAALGTTQTLAWGSTYYLPAVLANPIASDLRISTATVFLWFSAGLLVTAFVGPLSGRLIDRFGGHRVLPASNVVLASALALLATSHDAATMALAWLLLGAGMAAGLYEAAFSTLARVYREDARRAITGITLFAGFASTVCWPISAWLGARYGWREACLVWASVHVLFCMPINASLPRTSARAAATAGSDMHVPRSSGRRRAMLALALVFGCTWFSSTAMAAHLPRLLETAGLTQPAAIAAAALVGPAQVAARFMESLFLTKTHPLVSARIASLAPPAGAAALLIAGPSAAYPFALLHGAGNGIMTIANGTLPLYLFGATGYGLRQGLMMVPARLMQAAAPLVFDLALARFGIGALAVTIGASLCGTLLLFAVRPRPRAGSGE